MRFVPISLAATTLMMTASATGQSTPVPIAGNWRTDDNTAIITVGPCSSGSATMCGRISRFLVAEPAGGFRDGNNPNRALRTRPMMGVEVLSAFTWRDGAWHGRGYSPQEGRNFTGTVRAQGNRLTIRGCVAIFCRTLEWTRAR